MNTFSVNRFSNEQKMKKIRIILALPVLFVAVACGLFARTPAQDQQKAMEARYVRRK